MKKLIIIGGGFAGLKLARELSRSQFEVWLFDKNNFHQFQPLLYQVATAGLEPSSISFPLRKVFQNRKNMHIRMGEVLEILPELNKISTSIGEFNYDVLVIATGTTTNFFGNSIIEKNAIPMKSVDEALYLRNKLLQNFEDALSATENEKQFLMNIVVVGGGPTGVEISGALAEMKNYLLPKDYPELDFKKMNIYLVEAGPKILSSMSEISSSKSKEFLEKLGVNVLISTLVKSFDGNKLELGNGNFINTHTVIWGAGVKGNIINGIPGNKLEKGQRVIVDGCNKLIGYNNIYAIGDIACIESEKYPRGHPQLASIATEQAGNLATNLKHNTKTPYLYKDKGSMATVGRNLAVVDLPNVKFQGFFAWLFWMFLHLMLILGVKNKLIIFVNWMWMYFTFDQSLRIIIKPFKKKCP